MEAVNTIKRADTYWVKIFVAANRNEVEKVCRQTCLDMGLCVTIEDCSYVYAGGLEKGVIVGLINYPRFPESNEVIFRKAEDLAEKILVECYQGSLTIMTPRETIFYSRRGED